MSPCVLAADDDPSVRKLLEAMLSSAGYRVTTVADGLEALQEAARAWPDIVLLDVCMPVMDGYEACRQLKRMPQADYLPVVFITALAGDPQGRIKASEVDGDDFLAKPFRRDELLARVRSLLRLKSLIQERRRLEVEQARLESELALERFKAEEEARRRSFYREVIQAVTGGKLLLLDPDDFCRAVARLEGLDPRRIGLDGPSAVAKARRLAEEAGRRAGLDADRLHALVISVSEAATNAVKHAGSGDLAVGSDPEKILVWVRDQGPGIDSGAIVKATLVRGYSTAVSLGLGFSILLDQMDRVCLCTGATGTQLLLELDLASQNRELQWLASITW